MSEQRYLGDSLSDAIRRALEVVDNNDYSQEANSVFIWEWVYDYLLYTYPGNTTLLQFFVKEAERETIALRNSKQNTCQPEKAALPISHGENSNHD